MTDIDKKNTTQDWHLYKIFVGLGMFLIPLVIYAASRIVGAIPNEQAWWAQGTNHGPWRWELPGIIFLICILGLSLGAPLMTLWGLIDGIKLRKWKYFFYGLFQGLAYVVFLKVQLHYLFWTID